MPCERCGVEAPTRRVNLYQNIGVLVMRFTESTECRLCKSCINGVFWKYTLVNLTLGWWGAISMILNPLIILSNTIQYLLSLGLKSGSSEALVPNQFENSNSADNFPAGIDFAESDFAESDFAESDFAESDIAKAERIECPFCRKLVSISGNRACPSCRATL